MRNTTPIRAPARGAGSIGSGGGSCTPTPTVQSRGSCCWNTPDRSPRAESNRRGRAYETRPPPRIAAKIGLARASLRVGAVTENRTRISSVAGSGSTLELPPRSRALAGRGRRAAGEGIHLSRGRGRLEPPEGLAPSSFLVTSEVPRCLGVGGETGSELARRARRRDVTRDGFVRRRVLLSEQGGGRAGRACSRARARVRDVDAWRSRRDSNPCRWVEGPGSLAV